ARRGEGLEPGDVENAPIPMSPPAAIPPAMPVEMRAIEDWRCSQCGKKLAEAAGPGSAIRCKCGTRNEVKVGTPVPGVEFRAVTEMMAALPDLIAAAMPRQEPSVINLHQPPTVFSEGAIQVHPSQFVMAEGAINVTAPTIPPIQVDAHFEPAVVNVTTPAVTVEQPSINVTTPEIKVPDVVVNTGETHVAAPQVNVTMPEPKPVKRTVVRDKSERIIGVTEDKLTRAVIRDKNDRIIGLEEN
ncbi:MAG: hypothetical protein ABIN55_01990, partial [Aeromicrobium sp.]